MGLSLRELLLLQIRTTGDTAALTSAQNQIQKTGLAAAQSSLKLFGLSHAFQTMGASLQKIGIVLTGATVASIKFASDFEHEMAIVRTQTDFTAQKFQRIEDAILDVSTNSSRPLSELEEGLFDIFSTIDANIPQAVGALRLLSKAAIAGNTDIRTSSRSAIAMLNAYGMDITKLNKVLDIQFQLVRFGAGTYEEIASAIGLLLPSSVAAGQSLDTVAGVLAFLTRNGMSASEAVTSASRAMDLITRPEIRENLKKTLGIDVVDEATGKFKQIDQIMFEMATTGGLAKMSEPKRAKIFEEIFGVGEIRANRFFKTAIPRFEELNNLIEKTADSGGAMNRAYEIVADTFEIRWGKFLNTLRVIGIEFGMTLLPVLEDFIKLGRNFIEWFRELDPETKEFLARFIAIAGIIALVSGTILKVVGSFAGMISIMQLAGVSFGFVAAAGGIVIGVVAAIAAAAIILWQNWDEIAPKIKEWWENIQQWAGETWEKLKEVWEDIQELIGPIIIEIADTIRTTLTDIGAFILATWDQISTWTSERWNKIKETVRTILEIIRGVWDQFGDNLIRQVQITWDWIKGQIQGVLKIIQGILDVFMGIITLDWDTFWTGIKEIATGIWTLIKNAWRTLWDTLLNILNVAWDNIREAVVTGWQKVKTFFAELPGKILDFFKDVGSWLYNAGRDLVGGFLRGIKDALLPGLGDLFDRGELTGIIAQQLGIHSPSTAMIPLGEDFAMGFLVGISKHIGKIKTVFDEVMNQMRELVKSGFDKTSVEIGQHLEKLLNSAEKTLERLKAKIEEFQNTIQQGFSEFTNVVGGIQGLLGQLAEGQQLSGGAIGDWLGTQLADAQHLADALGVLAAMGLNPEILAQIAAQGPAGLVIAETLIQGGQGLIDQINATLEQIHKITEGITDDLSEEVFGKQFKEAAKAVEHLKEKIENFIVKMTDKLNSFVDTLSKKDEEVAQSANTLIKAFNRLANQVNNLDFISAQHGYEGMIQRPTMFLAHPGEHVSIGHSQNGDGAGTSIGAINIYGDTDPVDIVRELEWRRRTRPRGSRS